MASTLTIIPLIIILLALIEIISTKNDINNLNSLNEINSNLEESPKLRELIKDNIDQNLQNDTLHNMKITNHVVNYDNLTLFTEECNNSNAMSPNYCTNHKYSGYWCCHVDYIASPTPSYCKAYTDLEAKEKVVSRPIFYSYTCLSNYYRLAGILILIIIAIII